MDLAGRRVWLTGASSGIGAALAEVLLRRGCRVALYARNRERLEEVRAGILARHPAPSGREKPLEADIIIQVGDVTDRARVREAVAEVEAVWGGIDLAILNAGAGGWMPGEKFDAGEVRELFEVNLMGAAFGIEAALPGMLRRGSGVIVGVSSLAAYRGFPQYAHYSASKAALAFLLESLRVDLAPRGIRVVTIYPGFVKTPLTDRNRFKMPLLMSARRAAEIVVRGIERGRRQILFPLRLIWLMRLLMLLPPALYDSLLGRLYRKVAPRKADGEGRKGPSPAP